MSRGRWLRWIAAAAVVGAAVAASLLLLHSTRGSSGEPRRSGGSSPRTARERPPVHPSVVLVVFDELPLTSLMDTGGRIDRVRFPHFADLADHATWYRGATAVHDSTELAVPAILDGRYPRRRLPHDYFGHPHNLFTLLGRRYRMEVSEEATRLCPPTVCRGPPTGQVTKGNRVLHNLFGGRPERFKRFVRSIRPYPVPTLYFKHVLLPHVPWQYLPSGSQYRRHAREPIRGLNGPPGFGDPYMVKVSYQRHLLQTGFVDRLLGDLMGRLRATGVWEKALVVVTADHGIGFHLGADRRTVTPRNIQDLAPVPLFVKSPIQQRARVDDRHVETIDVVPTIARYTHLRPSWRPDGRPVERRPAHGPARVIDYHRIGTRLNTVGGRYVIDAARLARLRHRALLRRGRLYGRGAWWPSAFAFGPHPELLGRRLSRLRVARSGRARVRVRLNGLPDLGSVYPPSGFMPCELTARVLGGDPGARRPVAVSVNGLVAATGVTVHFAENPAERLVVILPEWPFKAGANDVQVFAIRAGPSGLALVPLQRAFPAPERARPATWPAPARGRDHRGVGGDDDRPTKGRAPTPNP